MPSQAQRRVIDPILSNVVLGYKHPDHIGMELFPRVTVIVSAGKIIRFGKDSFRLYNSTRAPGGATKRVQFGYTDGTYGLENTGLEALVPIEHQRDAAIVPKIDLASSSVNGLMRVESLILEKAQADLARNAAGYDANHKVTLAGNSQWSDYANSTPIQDINAAREAIRVSTGMYPNVIELPALVFDTLAEHPDIVDKLKYTTLGVVTEEILARILKVDKIIVGKAIGFDDADASIDIWGKDVVLAYVPKIITTNGEPSYGYTYTLEGHPSVEVPYYENNRRSWVYPTAYERSAELTGITSGYLIVDAIA